MTSTDISKPLKLSEAIQDLIETWNGWMLGNSIALDKTNANVIKGIAANFCETKIKLRYYLIESIDEIFEQKLLRDTDKKPNG